MTLFPVIEWLLHELVVFSFGGIKECPVERTLEMFMAKGIWLLFFRLTELSTYFICHWSCLHHLHVGPSRNEYWFGTFSGLYQIILPFEHLLPLSRHRIFGDSEGFAVDRMVYIAMIPTLLLMRAFCSIFVFNDDVLLWLLVSWRQFFASFTTTHVTVSSFLVHWLIDFVYRHLGLTLWLRIGWWSLPLRFSDIITLTIDRWVMKIAVID